jgi:rhamnopyranosyl-N-acetylglucosaminyl-diphospho-decaprenol beta-1,3/1,4-galactofuranosyltransferase
MDDDGAADESALEKLLEKTRPGRVALNSLVLATHDPSRLSFGMPIANERNGFPSLRKPISNLKELLSSADEENTVAFAAFFNGSLIRAETVREVGNILKELFIWGDELDFYWRLAARGEIRTVLDAIHYHPEHMIGSLPVWKMYYGLRNGIYINQQHLDRKLLRNARQILKYTILFLPRPRDWKWFFYAISDGFRGNITVRIEP